MAMVVKNNMSAINTLNTLNKNQSALSKSLEKVSSGMKINGAVDDASGYAISERMRVQIRSLDQDNQNTQNGNSMMKVAEGAVSSTVEILKTLKEKVINAANDTNTDADRATIQKELDQSIDQINDNAAITFNGKYLVDGSHNQKIDTATVSSFTNQSLATDTSGTTKFTEMKDRTGRSLNILSSDTITVSFTHQGKTYVTSAKVSTDMTFNKILELANSANTAIAKTAASASSWIGLNASGDSIYTASGASALTIGGTTGGVHNSIGGITFSITDTNGSIKKTTNAYLDDFTETIRAQDTSQDNAMNFQIGTKANQAIRVSMTDMRSEALGLTGSNGATLNISTREKANAAINVLDNAIQKALDQQTSLGSVQMRLNYTSTNLTTSAENVQAAESTIRDADMAKEMTNYTKNNVLMQAAQSMLSQANQTSSGVLSLLQ
ncbi:flagellin [Selenomonas sp. TAMA-11512]|uniref:flagellin n=1 Tax=Selenomonas sp. TAMA-11512 TaxID=3095337 RepID=UPI00309180EB|nr:flagellin [Selenomonas sp. TAMA-11512]